MAAVQGPLLYRGPLHTGSLMHLPRGFPHAATAEGEGPSMHLTLSAIKVRGQHGSRTPLKVTCRMRLLGARYRIGKAC